MWNSVCSMLLIMYRKCNCVHKDICVYVLFCTWNNLWTQIQEKRSGDGVPLGSGSEATGRGGAFCPGHTILLCLKFLLHIGIVSSLNI